MTAAVNPEPLRRNLDAVRLRIADACRRSGRSPDDVTLVGVTKYGTLEQARALASVGLRDLGENRAREGGERRREIAGDIRWHMIGRLQTNKAKIALQWADVLHSLDRPALAEKAERILSEDNKVLPAYVQVNAGAEDQKAGVRPEDAEGWVRELREKAPHLKIEGLMMMAPYDAPPDVSRPLFRRLRELAQRCDVSGLSMGMSGDFETAIEEGATIVRVGRALLQ